MDINVGDHVKCADGTWGKVKVVLPQKLIVRVKGLDEEWDREIVVKKVES